MNNKGLRAKYGQVIIEHKGKFIPTSVGSDKYEGIFSGQRSVSMFPSTLGNIPLGYAHRPDLIANLFLNTPDAWWVICDIFEQLNSGSSFRIPASL